MKTYLVGGAVRDILLGVEPKDRDYVVVGATPDEMLRLGFSQVGASFPVFLHPRTGEEYALARTERKTGVGYNGFETSFDSTVTLEEDLLRRDLTINAMAMDLELQTIIDPYGGQEDLKAGILRHTSEAFAEDPVRVLRTARFAARFGYSFNVHDTTFDLMRRVAPELEFVPQERIWAEIFKGLSEVSPYSMFKVLKICGALDQPVLAPYERGMAGIWPRAFPHAPLHVRVGLLCAPMSKQQMEHCKVPTEYSRLALALHRHLNDLLVFNSLPVCDQVRLLESVRAFSEPTLLKECLDVVYQYKLFLGDDRVAENGVSVVNKVLEVAKSVDAEAIAKAQPSPKMIKQAIFDARVAALTK